MKLLERKQQLVDTCTNIRSNIVLAYSPDELFRTLRNKEIAKEVNEEIQCWQEEGYEEEFDQLEDTVKTDEDSRVSAAEKAAEHRQTPSLSQHTEPTEIHPRPPP